MKNVNSPYLSVCIFFFVLISAVLLYSYFYFPDKHPIACVVKSYTGENCPSCGLSRAFSYYTHLDFEAGKQTNALSLPVFLFFLFQLFARGSLIVYFIAVNNRLKPLVAKLDSIISISLFLLAFLPLILNL